MRGTQPSNNVTINSGPMIGYIYRRWEGSLFTYTVTESCIWVQEVILSTKKNQSEERRKEHGKLEQRERGISVMRECVELWWCM